MRACLRQSQPIRLTKDFSRLRVRNSTTKRCLKLIVRVKENQSLQTQVFCTCQSVGLEKSTFILKLLAVMEVRQTYRFWSSLTTVRSAIYRLK